MKTDKIVQTLVDGYGNWMENPKTENGKGSCTGNHQNDQITESNGKNKINNIRVLGSGCKNCHTLFVNTNEALKAMGISCEAEYITDMTVIASYGIMEKVTISNIISHNFIIVAEVYFFGKCTGRLHLFFILFS